MSQFLLRTLGLLGNGIPEPPTSSSSPPHFSQEGLSGNGTNDTSNLSFNLTGIHGIMTKNVESLETFYACRLKCFGVLPDIQKRNRAKSICQCHLRQGIGYESN